ncbi:MAG TPA: TonB family protein, partial [Gemmatimonadaceae bacterium]|nr:TonB family protein [Gemmatimonadaceae bacterium]
NPNVGSIPKAQAVRLFFDHRPPYTEEWTESRNAGTLDSPDPGRLIINLMASQRLQVEVTPLNSRTAAALAFPVTGLIAASTPLQSACPSAWRGVMERLDSLARPSGGSSDRASVYFEFQVEKQAMQLPANPTPAYPPMLRSARVEGEVLAQFVVDTSGRAEPGTFKILKSTHDLFTQSVRDVLPTLRFSPAEMNGRRVRQLVQMPFPFRLTP